MHSQVQKTFRGHTERDVQEEKRRVTWLKWHVDQAEYEQACARHAGLPRGPRRV